MITYIISIKQFKDKLCYLFGGVGSSGGKVRYFSFFLFFSFSNMYFYLGVMALLAQSDRASAF